jgi:DnaJ-class molecular chaperone
MFVTKIEMNPRQVLGVSQTASDDEIKKAFKKLAVQHHPDKGGDPAKFKEINNAYIALTKGGEGQSSHPQHGAEFHDVFNMFHQFHQFHSNRVFRKTVEVRIALEDTYKDKSVNIHGKTLNIPSGTPLFSEMHVTDNLVVVLKPQKHPLFDMDNQGNLIIRQSISLFEALSGFNKRVKHPDGKMLFVSVPAVISNGHTKVFKSKGIPVGNHHHISNLVIRFEVIFPQNIDMEPHKETLKTIFQANLPEVKPQPSDECLV